jgi:hypothetical protein
MCRPLLDLQLRPLCTAEIQARAVDLTVSMWFGFLQCVLLLSRPDRSRFPDEGGGGSGSRERSRSSFNNNRDQQGRDQQGRDQQGQDQQGRGGRDRGARSYEHGGASASGRNMPAPREQGYIEKIKDSSVTPRFLNFLSPSSQKCTFTMGAPRRCERTWQLWYRAMAGLVVRWSISDHNQLNVPR